MSRERKPLPVSQDWFIQPRVKMNYPADEGFCLGVAMEAMVAYLNGNIERFDQRYAIICEYEKKLGNLAIAVKEVKEENKKWSAVARVKLDAEYFQAKTASAKMKNEDKQKEDKKKEDKEAIKLFIKELLKNKKFQDEYNKKLKDYIQKEKAHDLAKKSPKEKTDFEILSEMESAADAVEVYHESQGNKYAYLLPEETSSSEKLSLDLLTPFAADEKNTLKCVHDCNGIYTIAELVDYFVEIKNAAMASKHKIASIVESSNHALMFGYDPHAKAWTFVDANKLPSQIFQDEKALAQEVYAGFAFASKSAQHVAFHTRVYSLAPKEEITADKKPRPREYSFVSVLNDSKNWKTIHAITIQKAKQQCVTGATWLYIAARVNDIITVTELLKQKINLDLASDSGATPLFIAAQNGHTAIVEILVKAGADLNLADNNGATPLFVAAYKGHTAIVEILVTAGADLNSVCNNGATPLYIAAENGHTAIVEILVTAGADLNSVCNNRVTPLFIAAQEGRTDIVKILVAAGANLNLARDDGATPLYIAAEEGRADIVEILVRAGADLNSACNDGATPLYIAAEEGRADIVETLVRAGANLNSARNNGATPLFMAAQGGHSKVVSLLLEKESKSINTGVQAKGSILLNFAKEKNRDQQIIELFKRVAPDTKPEDLKLPGFTPLHAAIFWGHKKVISYFLCHDGVDLTKKSLGISPLDFAIAMGHIEVVIVLLLKMLKKSVDQLAELGDNPKYEKLNTEIKQIVAETKAEMKDVQDEKMAFKTLDSFRQKLLTQKQKIPDKKSHPNFLDSKEDAAPEIQKILNDLPQNNPFVVAPLNKPSS